MNVGEHRLAALGGSTLCQGDLTFSAPGMYARPQKTRDVEVLPQRARQSWYNRQNSDTTPPRTTPRISLDPPSCQWNADRRTRCYGKTPRKASREGREGNRLLVSRSAAVRRSSPNDPYRIKSERHRSKWAISGDHDRRPRAVRERPDRRSGKRRVQEARVAWDGAPRGPSRADPSDTREEPSGAEEIFLIFSGQHASGRFQRSRPSP